jgi:hypothetical protein
VSEMAEVHAAVLGSPAHPAYHSLHSEYLFYSFLKGFIHSWRVYWGPNVRLSFIIDLCCLRLELLLLGMLLVCLCQDNFSSLRETRSSLVLELAASKSAILGCPAYLAPDGPHLQDIINSLLRFGSDINPRVRLGSELWLR